MGEQNEITDKTRIRQSRERACYGDSTIKKIIDSGYVAHIAFVHNGYPVNIPMIYWREEGYIYWHGSTKSRAVLASAGDSVCLTITHFDGLVFAKSAFHHSANYRSVMVFGTAEIVPDNEKIARLKYFMERISLGRNVQLRPIKDKELKATSLLRIPIDRVSAKVRSGPPVEDQDDNDWPVWAGVVPVRQHFLAPISVKQTDNNVDIPNNITELTGISI